MIDPNLIVTIDREVGWRICWALTQVGKITRRKLVKPKKIKKILFIKLSEMGSTVLAYPTIQAAKHHFPDAKIYFLTFKGNEKLIEILDVAPKKNVFSLDIFSLSGLFLDLFKIVKKLRSEKIDVVIDLELLSRISAILVFLIKAPLQTGFQGYQTEGLYRGKFFTHRVLYNHYLHTSLAFLTLVESLLRHPETEMPLLKKSLQSANLELPRIKSSQKDKEKLWQKLQAVQPEINPSLKLVVFNTRGGDFLPARRWPKEKFIQLGKILLKNPHLGLILAGLENDHDYNQEIALAIAHPHCANFAGQTNFHELLTLFNLSHLFITNDSGPAHFAALTPIYIITLFGVETPLLYSPLSNRNISISAGLACSPCVSAYNARYSICNNNLCVQKISVGEVLTQAQKILGLPSPKQTDKTAVKPKKLLL